MKSVTKVAVTFGIALVAAYALGVANAKFGPFPGLRG